MKLAIIVSSCLIAAATAAHAEGDAAAGATVFKKCMACHSVDPTNKVGPSLQNVVGRPVATVEGFRYSKAMVAFGEGKTWDEALLTEYLAAPRAVVKGTSMAFAGLKKPEDVANVIAYLKAPPAE
ncbi:cytochrome c family protein [Mycoplana sp. MJR14]|jgi:cytochrome c|uniref:c-type cytochrome n=1 Tax=Mycoplana sp. MJR14 TaxID=3032583 RepID=UPI000DD51D6B|nr:cytochrome c family protein [Mycoplana sp. MJR14]MDF1634740.1 cytochrome c family protein [Mycoplana sp. MJR14]